MSASQITNLRSYLKVLEEAGELSRVKIPVSLDQEIGAICLRNLRRNGPGLLFERPAGGSLPLAVDLMASRRRYALALGVQPEELAAEWNRRTSTPLPPVIVERGVCQENVMIGKDVDLSKLPVTQTRNVGLYRNQVHDRQMLGILAAPYTHLNLQRNKAANEPFPVALV